MGYDARIESLRSKHADLEAAVDLEARRPLPDERNLLALKRQKLRIKDEIQRMSN
ncbi:MAG: YdcH family protein [Rhodospirillaceae bacterium]